MKTKKYFDTPTATVMMIMPSDIITESPANPAPAYENQLELWDLNIEVQS